MTDEKRYK